MKTFFFTKKWRLALQIQEIISNAMIIKPSWGEISTVVLRWSAMLVWLPVCWSIVDRRSHQSSHNLSCNLWQKGLLIMSSKRAFYCLFLEGDWAFWWEKFGIKEEHFRSRKWRHVQSLGLLERSAHPDFRSGRRKVKFSGGKRIITS